MNIFGMQDSLPGAVICFTFGAKIAYSVKKNSYRKLGGVLYRG